MKMITKCSTNEDLDAATDEVLSDVLAADTPPDVVLFSSTVGYDVPQLYEKIQAKLGDTPFQGGTSCNGVMTQSGFISHEGRAMSACALWEADTDFGIGYAAKGDDPKKAGMDAIEMAIENAGREGELPSAIWLVSSPGGEEAILEGINEKVGGDVPMVGGSSADNTIEGNWYQFTNEGLYTDSITLVAIFRDDHIITVGFHSGYDPTENTGVATKVADREIVEIDGKPAAEVYNDWTGGAIEAELADGGQILGASNLYPLGRKVGTIAGMDYFQLSHPERVTKPHDGVTLFTDVVEGDTFYCMHGSVDNLTKRVGNVVQSCLERDEFEKAEIEGALIIFCAGCMLTIGDRMEQAQQAIQEVLGNEVPYWSMFTFGEQGSLAGGENRHGNLMIATLIFTNRAY